MGCMKAGSHSSLSGFVSDRLSLGFEMNPMFSIWVGSNSGYLFEVDKCFGESTDVRYSWGSISLSESPESNAAFEPVTDSDIK